MKEIYRSYGGLLTVNEIEYGYIVYETKNKYVVQFITLEETCNPWKFRVSKEDLPNFSEETITDVYIDIDNGHIDGSILYKGKYYKPRKVMEGIRDYVGNWRRYI